MKTIDHEPALKALTLISELCSEYNQAESTLLLINLIKAFQAKDLRPLSQNQLSKTFNFVNKLTTVYLAIQQISTTPDKPLYQENDVEEIEPQHQSPSSNKHRLFQDKIAFGTVPENFAPNTVIKNFFNKYALYESQLLSDLLTGTLVETKVSKAKLTEMEAFQRDLDDLLKANYLLFQHEH